ncbi:MAG TPA: DNA adenine methylase [Terriglobia bacterium]|nr:DNA adenine methylase [Terracidiphilus sp.]HZT69580.1 DNA adenine methylase [Terriglobia bacterium]
MLRSPLGWLGGKSKLRAEIISRIPPHTTYVEVFGCAAWVLFGKPPETSKVEVLNDLDGELINFWRVLKHRPAEFAEEAASLVASGELWQGWRALPAQGSEVERAIRFLAVLKLGFGAKRISTAFGSHRLRPPKHVHIASRADFGRIIARLRTVWIERLDWRRCIEKYDASTTFFYLDPPYRCPGAKGYAFSFTDEDHRALADALRGVRGKWMLSYNDDPWIAKIYERRGWYIERLNSLWTVNGSGPLRTQELLISNFKPATAKPHEAASKLGP